MQMLITVLEKALPVFIMLALGMLCRKRQIISREGIGAMKTFAVNITLPAVMFSAFATASYSRESLIIPVLIFALCVVMLLLGKALCRMLGVRGRLSPFLASGFEAGMLGYALFALLFPGESSAAFAIIDLGQVLFVFTLYKALLAGGGGLKSVVDEAVHAPTIWAIAAGLLVGASGLYRAMESIGAARVVSAAADFVSAPTSAVILLTIGYDLTPETIRWKKTAKLAGVRFAAAFCALCMALLFNRFVLDGMMHTGALMLMFILPPPYVLPVFADVEEERADIDSALSVLTLAGLVIFMVLIFLFQ